MKPNAYAAACPTRQILDRVGDKWAVLILLLIRDEPMRFNALRRAIEGISQKMLSQVLKSPGARRADQRRVFATVPVTVEYSITPLGKTLADRGRSAARLGRAKPEGGAVRATPLRRADGARRRREWCARRILRDAARAPQMQAPLAGHPVRRGLSAQARAVSGILGRPRRRRATTRERVKAQNCPALASSTSTRSSISDSTASRPGSPEDDFRLAAASRSRFTVDGIEIAGQQSDLEIVEHVERAPAPLHRALAALDRIFDRRPAAPSSASMLAAAFGAVAERVSGAAVVLRQREAGGRRLRALLAGVPSVVPFGP